MLYYTRIVSLCLLATHLPRQFGWEMRKYSLTDRSGKTHELINALSTPARKADLGGASAGRLLCRLNCYYSNVISRNRLAEFDGILPDALDLRVVCGIKRACRGERGIKE